jgi:FdhD protein
VEKIAQRSVTRIDAGRTEEVEDALVVERELCLVVRGERFLISSCSPGDERELVAGFLFSAGKIDSIDEILSIDLQGDVVRVEVPRGRRRKEDRVPVPIESAFTLPAERLLQAARECQDRGRIFRETGGTHAAAIADSGGLVNFFEDTSRSHAFEKAVGDALLRRIPLGETFVFLSSRIYEQLLHRIVRCGIPVVGAVSAPTLQAVEEAQRLGVCLCGFVRGERLTLYSNSWRVRP